MLSAMLVTTMTTLTAQNAGAPDNAQAQPMTTAAQPATTQTTALPDLPDEPTFEVPEDEVFLDLPGSDSVGTAVAGDAETISVDFPEEDVRDIIRSVAELYELNVVIPDSLAGSVSIKLRDVSWQQVFDVVLEPLNYTYIIDGNIIKIKSQDELAVEPVDTRVFIVDFASAAEIRGSVEPLIDSAAGGKIQVDTRSNALVITERPSRMNDIQEIIETLDRPTEQVMIESKFVEITRREADSLGVDWQSMIGWGLSAEAGTDGLQILGRQYDKISGSGGLDETVRTDQAVFSADAFTVVLSALETNADIELVSNPTIVTMNNKKATINIGEEFPIPSYRYNDDTGQFEVSNFEYKNIGINLAVVPQINSAGYINLNIQPEISSRSGEVNFGGAAGAVIPIISTRKTNSSVTIKSGYTLAIGGLIEQVDQLSSSSVPILGSIPGLGRLFSSQGKDTNKRNLVIFITAKILSASGATYEDVFSRKTLYEMGISDSDVPGYEPPEQEVALIEEVQRSLQEVEDMEAQLKLEEQLNALNAVKNAGQEVPVVEEKRSYPRRAQ
jgi:type IV pilus assembly protein PilQ